MSSKTNASEVFQALMDVIESRKRNPSPGSYTSQLLGGGVPAIGAKITEEAAEVIDAARSAEAPAGNEHLTHEAADLIYHLFVMLSHCGVSLPDVAAELARRFGMSGLEEKASRSHPHTSSTKDPN